MSVYKSILHTCFPYNRRDISTHCMYTYVCAPVYSCQNITPVLWCVTRKVLHICWPVVLVYKIICSWTPTCVYNLLEQLCTLWVPSPFSLYAVIILTWLHVSLNIATICCVSSKDICPTNLSILHFQSSRKCDGAGIQFNHPISCIQGIFGFSLYKNLLWSHKYKVTLPPLLYPQASSPKVR